jgi:hypothetical protein
MKEEKLSRRSIKKVAREYEDYKGHPPATPDGNIVALQKSIASLFSAVSDLVAGYEDYIRALEEELGIGK